LPEKEAISATSSGPSPGYHRTRDCAILDHCCGKASAYYALDDCSGGSSRSRNSEAIAFHTKASFLFYPEAFREQEACEFDATSHRRESQSAAGT
jgi:hypothetical protein